MRQKKEINYLYFLFFYCAVSLVSLISLMTTPLAITPGLILYSLGQSLLEVGVFALLIQITKRRWLQNLYCTLFLTIWIVHFTNFTMLRLLDTSLSYLFKFFIGHGIFHIIQVFQAINMNKSMLGLIGVIALTLPVFAIFLYRITDRLSQKKIVTLSNQLIALSLCLTMAFLLLSELMIIPSLSYKSYEKYKKTLPFSSTFFSPKTREWVLKTPITPPRDPTSFLNLFTDNALTVKPNIYLFVIETLRKDFILPTTAPFLSSFEESHIQLPFSFANANATQQSWFSIFYSQFPYHWKQVASGKRGGSIPLQILKKMGYQIHIYSSADLSYFKMDELLFGPERMLADRIEEYGLNSSMPSWERDLCTFRDFEKDIEKEEGKQGHVYLFFLDATHSEYNFPKDFDLRFTPITEQIDYLSINTEHLECIKNRYRNSIAYVDSLMGKFFSTLKEKGIYDEAIIAITGDHGEEFFEEGSLFHGTHLNHYQTHVPILFKFQNPEPIQTLTATHIDIFPSIIHFLTKQEIDPIVFDGRSIFSPHKHGYRLATLQNGAQTPEEFTLENEVFKVRAHFSNPLHLYQLQNLKIISWETTDSTATDLPEDIFQMLLNPAAP